MSWKTLNPGKNNKLEKMGWVKNYYNTMTQKSLFDSNYKENTQSIIPYTLRFCILNLKVVQVWFEIKGMTSF